MAQQNDDNSAESHKPSRLGKVKHRTATLDGVHNKNKALYRLGVTAAEIHRSKALLTMGGSEDTYQQSLMYLNRNHQPNTSHSLTQNATKIHNSLPPKQDPLEHEYTKNSQTAETIDQSLLEKRESVSYSITWTHSQNHSNPPPRSNKSKSKSKSTESEEKKDESLKCLKSLSLESDSRSDRHHDTPIIDDIFNEKQSILNDTMHKHIIKYAQDDVNNDSTPIISKKLFSKRKSDSFFMNNHHVIIPRIYHRKYEPKGVWKMSVNTAKSTDNVLNEEKVKQSIKKTAKAKDWYQRFDDDDESKHSESEHIYRQKIDNKQNETKQKERDRWKQNRSQCQSMVDTSDVINSSAKVLKFFGDNPQNKTKVNWKVGASIDEIMKTRSLGLVNITEKDDEKRKKERNTFSRKAKFIEKISQIKLKWGSKANQAQSATDIESAKFLNNSDIDEERENTDNDINTMVIYPYNNGLNRRLSDSIRPGMLSIKIMKEKEKEKEKETRQSRTPNIEGIRDHKNGGYHIDQSLFTFQNPHQKKTEPIHTKKNKKYKYAFKRKQKNWNVLANKYGFKPSGKINSMQINEQNEGLKKLLSERKTLSEIVYIYYHSYGFCVEFIVYLITNIDIGCREYVSVISRHVDKQIKILHGLSIWQYILRHQLPDIDIKRFFYSFGPLIGKYKTLISPLHLSARKLIEIGGGKESHITYTTSAPECIYAFEIFKWLLFIGYDIDDGDVDNLITPQTILNHAPRILKQIVSYKRQFLFKQRQCMKAVDNTIYSKYKLLLDDDILQVIEKFTYNKYRRNKTGKAHKKFAKI